MAYSTDGGATSGATAGNDAPPAYPALVDDPPAYAPNYDGAPPAVNPAAGDSQLYDSGGAAAAAAPVAVQQPAVMPMTQMLSGIQPVGQVVQQPQVIYMIQQPNGQMQMVQPAAGGVVQQPVVYQMNGQTMMAMPAPAVVNNPYANGEPAVTTTATTTVPGATTMVIPGATPGAAAAKTKTGNKEPWRNSMSCAFLFILMAYIAQVYASVIDELTVWTESDSDDFYEEAAYFGYESFTYEEDWFSSETYDYDELCDTYSSFSIDTYCDLETRGETYQACNIISDIIGGLTVILLGNLILNCCCKESVNNLINGIKICSILTIISIAISMIVWLSDNEVEDVFDEDTGDIEWGQTMWIYLSCIFVYMIGAYFVFKKY